MYEILRTPGPNPAPIIISLTPRKPTSGVSSSAHRD